MLKKGLRNPSVIIIGAGMSGILMTIKLREAGITDITILEKKSNIGGTWRENSYPGVACDIPAHMYTYSFEPNPEWSHRFAYGSEIQEYFERVGRKYGVTEKVRFNEAVVDSQYKNAKWYVKTSKGEHLVADFIVCATGILHHPAKPNITGLESFKGDMFHTAQWNHDVELKGKRIGVIGTGSTAAQVIPELIKKAGKVSVFQRTAQWIVNIPNRQYSEAHKARWRNNPHLMTVLKNRYAKAIEQTFSKAVTGHKLQHLMVSIFCKYNLRTSIKDKSLRKKLTPSYTPGCKRLIANNTFYSAIQKPNADLVTQGIERITEQGIITKDGQLHELDVLVLSTGFKPFNFMRPMNLVGKDGVHINEIWHKKVKAYRSICIPQLPNFFLMLGPNTPIGNYSVIAMSEVQCDYVLKLIAQWRQGSFDEISATPKAMNEFNDYLKKGMGKTAWVGGCQSWYLDDDGDPAMWPYTWNQWVKEMAEPCMSDFHTEFCQPQASSMAV